MLYLLLHPVHQRCLIALPLMLPRRMPLLLELDVYALLFL
jgi:hypothetical protein